MSKGIPGEVFATIEKALDERTIGHNPERLCLMKVDHLVHRPIPDVSGGNDLFKRHNHSIPYLRKRSAGWRSRRMVKGNSRTVGNPNEDARHTQRCARFIIHRLSSVKALTSTNGIPPLIRIFRRPSAAIPQMERPSARSTSSGYTLKVFTDDEIVSWIRDSVWKWERISRLSLA